MKARPTIESIDDYIARCDADVRPVLVELRATIRTAAPDAEEAIAYQMPTFRLHGNLVHFAACAGHVGFYPAPSAIEAFADRLRSYHTSKGAIQFPHGRPVPWALVAAIVKYRVRENLERQRERDGKRRGDGARTGGRTSRRG